MFETVDGHYRVRCDRCREAVQDLPTPATAPIEDAKAAARLECHLDSQDRMFCIRCQFVGDSVIGASVTEPPAYCLDALPKRFLDLHFMEFASWSLISDRPRVFRLRWPSRAQRLEADSTIRLDRRIAIRYGRRVIEVFIPDEHDRLTLDRYIAAIKSEDVRYAAKEGV